MINKCFIPSHVKGVHRVCCFTAKQIQSAAAIYWPRLTTGQQNDGKTVRTACWCLNEHLYQNDVHKYIKSKYLSMASLREFKISGFRIYVTFKCIFHCSIYTNNFISLFKYKCLRLQMNFLKNMLLAKHSKRKRNNAGMCSSTALQSHL